MENHELFDQELEENEKEHQQETGQKNIPDSEIVEKIMIYGRLWLQARLPDICINFFFGLWLIIWMIFTAAVISKEAPHFSDNPVEINFSVALILAIVLSWPGPYLFFMFSLEVIRQNRIDYKKYTAYTIFIFVCYRTFIVLLKSMLLYLMPSTSYNMAYEYFCLMDTFNSMIFALIAASVFIK